MASSKDYLDFVLDFLTDIDAISFKKMMGEYLIYSNGILFGGIYDNRIIIGYSGIEIDYIPEGINLLINLIEKSLN